MGTSRASSSKSCPSPQPAPSPLRRGRTRRPARRLPLPPSPKIQRRIPMTSNGKSLESSLPPQERGGVLTDALVEALGHIVDDQRRAWDRERELILAQAKA